MISRLPVVFVLALIALFLNGACKTSADDDDEPTSVVDPFEQNKLLGRGINMGNALEAPNEGEWGVLIKAEYFAAIKEAGFNSVRIPVRWSAHAAIDSPYVIDPVFMSRVDWVIGQARLRELAVVLNIHHYEEIFVQPQQEKKRFTGIWKQIAGRYKSYSNQLFFEILNEPNDKLTPEIWNEFLSEALQVIRATNPQRTVIIGTAEWGGVGSLSKLKIPAEEKNVIVTVHYYNPFQFTHQGAEWVSGSDAWLGTTWTASNNEKQAVNSDLDKVWSYSLVNKRPIFVGEFGAYSKADMDSRARWTNFVARGCEEREFSWAYWEFCSGFGAYDKDNKVWRAQLLNALVP